ncbi:MAG: hypothetical protein H0X33_04225 [Taibaiella sp.]|nr:hypothetical protein [Taibaiella sp.]
MKILSPRLHGIIDYLVIVFLFLSPKMFGMTGFPATFTYILGSVHLLLTILTIYPLGIIRVIPFRVHGVIEVLVSLVLFWMALMQFGDIPLVRNYYIGFSIAVFIVWLITNYKKGLKT